MIFGRFQPNSRCRERLPIPADGSVGLMKTSGGTAHRCFILRPRGYCTGTSDNFGAGNLCVASRHARGMTRRPILYCVGWVVTVFTFAKAVKNLHRCEAPGANNTRLYVHTGPMDATLLKKSVFGSTKWRNVMVVICWMFGMFLGRS